MPPTSPKTKSGPRKLSEVAKHLVVPTDISATGWPAVHKTCREKLGITFDDWQDGAGRVILAKRDDGNLAAMIDGVGLSLPRQVGKTYLIGAMVFALCVNIPGLLVIWSAHHARTHGETFLSMTGFAGRGRVAPHVKQVFLGSGDEEIRFHNNSRILFGARERGFGRGIPGVDILIFDEAQILSDKALANMLATMNTSRFGLQLYIGTPPKPEDMSEAFTRMRNEALGGTLSDGAWIEMGADPDAAADDRKQWTKANPSYPSRTPPQSMLRLKRKLKPDDWLREGLGIWDVKAQLEVMPNWLDCGQTIAEPPPPAAIGLAVSIDRAWSSIGVCSGGEIPHLGSNKRARGTEWIVAEAKRIKDEYGIPVVIAGRGPAASLIEPLKEAGVEPIVAGIDDYQDACANLFDRVEAGTVEHGHYDDLNDAVSVAGWTSGERRVWTRKSGDVSMLEAVTLALWGAGQDDDEPFNIW